MSKFNKISELRIELRDLFQSIDKLIDDLVFEDDWLFCTHKSFFVDDGVSISLWMPIHSEIRLDLKLTDELKIEVLTLGSYSQKQADEIANKIEIEINK